MTFSLLRETSQLHMQAGRCVHWPYALAGAQPHLVKECVEGRKLVLGPVVLQGVAQHDDPWLLDVRAHALVCHVLAADQSMHHCTVLWRGSPWYLLHLQEAC